MTRAGSFLVFAFCLLPFAFVTGAAQDPPVPQFRAGVNFVYVDAYPMRDGRLIEGLTAADFQVFEDGAAQKVEHFELIRFAPNAPDAERRDPNSRDEGERLAGDPRNRAFVIYLDTYHTTVAGSHAARQPVIEFLSRVIGPSDLFAVVTPDTDVGQIVFGQRLETIENELTKYWTWGIRRSAEDDIGTTPGLRADPRTPAEKRLWACYATRYPDLRRSDALVVALIDLLRLDLLFNSLEGLMIKLRSIREERSHVLLFSEGWLPERRDLTSDAWGGAMPSVGVTRGGRLGIGTDQPGQVDKAGCDSQLLRLSAIDFAVRFRDFLGQANRANVAFHPVDLAGLRASPSSGGQTRDREVVSTLRTLAENTDGGTVVNTNDLGGGLRRVANDLSAYYLLGYYSTNTKPDGRFRTIEVKLRPSKSKVSARRGYLAPSEAMIKERDMAARKAAAGPSPSDAALAVLARLGPTAEVYTYAAAASTELVVVSEIASRQLELGRWKKGADVRVIVTGANGAAVASTQVKIEPAWRGALARIPLAAGDAGPWRIRIRVDGDDGPLDDSVEVRRATGRLLGDPVLFRATPAAQSPLRPVADFQYRRTERVHIEWPILGALDRREARVLDRRGQPLALGATVTERDTNGRPMLAADVNLAPLTDGDYVIEVMAGQGSETERKFVAIRVVR